MQKVLITGASGFLGRHCLASLSANGAGEVHAVVRPGTRLENPAGPVHHLDLLDPGRVSTLLGTVKPSHLLHLAWIATPGEYMTSAANHLWLEGSLHLARTFAAHGGRRLVAAGSCAEYDWSQGVCHETDTPLKPASLYGQCKNSLRIELNNLAAQFDLSVAWGRIFWLYGPYEHPQRLVASTARALLQGQPINRKVGTHRRDFLYVHDAAQALVDLLRSKVTGAVNIGSGDAVSIRSLVKRLCVLAGHDEPDWLDTFSYGSSGEPPLVVADARRLRDEVGWTPRFSIDDGLAYTLAWWKARRIDQEDS